MVQTILKHRATLPDERRDSAEIGHVAAGQQQRPGPPGECCQRFFELVVRSAVADHKVRCAATCAPTSRALGERFDHLRMIGQAEIIVVAKSQQRLAIDHNVHALRGFQQRTLTIKVRGAAFSQAGRQIERHSPHTAASSKRQAGRALIRLLGQARLDATAAPPVACR